MIAIKLLIVFSFLEVALAGRSRVYSQLPCRNEKCPVTTPSYKLIPEGQSKSCKGYTTIGNVGAQNRDTCATRCGEAKFRAESGVGVFIFGKTNGQCYCVNANQIENGMCKDFHSNNDYNLYRLKVPSVHTKPPPLPPTTKSPESDKLEELEHQCEEDDKCHAAMMTSFADVGDAASGIAATQKMSAILSSGTVSTVGRSVTKFADTIKVLADKLGPFLKALGPLAKVAMMFTKTAEQKLLEELLEEVKTQFNRVNQRFDKVFEQLKDIRALIKDQHIRTRYSEAKDRITHSSTALEKVFEAPKDAIRGFIIQLKNIDDVKFSVYRLAEFMLKGTEMEDVFMEAENWNRSRVHARLLEHYNLITQGVKFYLTWLEMKSEDVKAFNKAFRDEVKADMEERLNQVLDKIDQIDKIHFTNDWENQYKIDFERLVKQGGNQKDMAVRVYNFIAGKYDWRDWMVIIYDATDGKEVKKHYIDKPCHTSVIHYKWHGVNALLVHVDPDKVAPNAKETKSMLEQTKTKGTWKQCMEDTGRHEGELCHTTYFDINDAKKSFESLPRGHCKYTVRAVIKTDLHVTIRAPSSRLTVLTRHGVHVIAMG